MSGMAGEVQKEETYRNYGADARWVEIDSDRGIGPFGRMDF